MKTTNDKKSKARAFLRFFVSGLTDQKIVDGFASAIMAGNDGSKDCIFDFLDAIYTLRAEFIAWDASSGNPNLRKFEARRFIADGVRVFDIENNFDVFRHLYLHGHDETKLRVCCLVEAVFFLRDDLIAWGRNDLNDWEQKPKGRRYNFHIIPSGKFLNLDEDIISQLMNDPRLKLTDVGPLGDDDA